MTKQTTNNFIIEQLAHGKKHKEIAMMLQLSPRTIEKKVCDLVKESGCANIPHLIFISCKTGII